MTDGIQRLLDWRLRVYAVELGPDDLWLDIGTVENYRQALELSYRHMQRERK